MTTESPTDSAPRASLPHDPHRRRAPLRQLVFLILLVLAVPLVPFMLFGAALEPYFAQTVRTLTTSTALHGMLLGLLALDIVLPVPSSGLITFVASQTSWASATLVSALGLCIGCGLGYEMARSLGRRWVHAAIATPDAERLERWALQYGAWMLCLTRPLPLLGETAVVLAGCLRVPRRMFYGWITLTNTAISAIYAAVGVLFADSAAWPLVLIATLFLPLLATGFVRTFAPVKSD